MANPPPLLLPKEAQRLMMREDAIHLACYAIQEMAHIHRIISVHDYNRSRSLLQLLQASYQQLETHPEGKYGDGSNWIHSLPRSSQFATMI